MIFENNRVRIFWFVQNTLIAKFGLLWGRILIMEKRGSFWHLINFSLEYISLRLNKWVWLRDRKMNLICKNKPSGGKEWSKYAKLESTTIWSSIYESICMFCIAFWCVGINHQKGGDWKGNVLLGHFYNVLVIKCPTHSERNIMCQTSKRCKSCNKVRF